jgi:hypothetical protein
LIYVAATNIWLGRLGMQKHSTELQLPTHVIKLPLRDMKGIDTGTNRELMDENISINVL